MSLAVERKILSRATYPGAPSYGGVRAWVEGSQARRNRTLAEASNLLGYKACVNYCTDYTFVKREHSC